MYFEDGMSGTLRTDILVTKCQRQLTATVYFAHDPERSVGELHPSFRFSAFAAGGIDADEWLVFIRLLTLAAISA